MTSIEAIKYLEYLQDNYTRKGALMCQAIDAAIAALKPKPICTNADRIRQMSDEELAKLLIYADTNICDICAAKHSNTYYDCEEESCEKGILAWLKQEAQNEV